jgi:hypothetical protein
MKCVFPPAIVLVCTCALQAQIIGRVNRLPDGSEQVRIQNNAKKALIAFVLSVKHVAPDTAPDRDSLSGPLVIISDPLIDGTAAPLQAGEERAITTLGFFRRIRPGSFRSGTHLLEESILTAGILADGTSAGDPILLGRLIIRRSNMLQAVETAMAALSSAGSHNVPRRQIVEEFQTLADSLNHWYLPLEQQVGRDLYQSIVGKLLNLPEPRLGEPFPPTDFAAQEISSLNQQRVRLLASEPSLREAAVLIGR